MKHLIITILLITALCYGVNSARAPNVEALPIKGNLDPSVEPQPAPPVSPDQYLIHSVPDSRSTSGSPGKNIVFAEDGQNAAVIFGRFSGDPTNIFQVMVAYSTDRGNTWTIYGPLSTFDARRVYPGLDARQDWPETDLMVHFAWHQAAQSGGNYLASPAFYSKEVSYPDGLITAAYELPNSEDWDVWLPCIGVKDSFVIYTATNMGTYLTTYNGYIWRSTDYGETWDNGRIFFPGPLEWMAGPHFRFGSDGYVFFLWCREVNPEQYWYYYCESFNYGDTWTDPQLLWQNTPPYQDMSNVTGWWYMYDCEVVRDTPVATVKFGTANLDYGEIWVYRPDSGGPGNWHFKGTKLVGGDSTAPQTYARFPTVAADDSGNIYVGYQAFLIIPGDTVWDCGLFVRPAGRDTWIDFGRCTFNGDVIEENHLEFAHNAALVGSPPDDSVVIAMVYHNAGDYPITGNLYFDYRAIPYDSIKMFQGIAESNRSLLKKFEVAVSPNPFQKSVKFTLPTFIGKAKLSIFDVTGKLVCELSTPNLQYPTSVLTWDGRKADGTLVNSGVYFYNVSTGSSQNQGKLILAR
ncbi:MAG: T9SS type A sorting domain-containing protein [candidate division WOR-3 bacterium]|nr:T9SS type A sorting domain-containing protein [candidate division WOR-3 bacterium]